MNLIECLKSGKRFRRPNSPCWWDHNESEGYEFSYQALVADDWEIEREPEVVEFICGMDGWPEDDNLKLNLIGKRWKARFVEIVE